MIKDIFFSFVEISAAASLLILALILFSPLINRRYAAKWKYWIWLFLTIRLLIPYNEISIPIFSWDILSRVHFSASTKEIKSALVQDPTTQSFSSQTDSTAPFAELISSGGVVVEIPRQITAPIMDHKGNHLGVTWMDIIVSIWLLGAASVIAVYLFSYIRYRRILMREGHPWKETLLWKEKLPWKKNSPQKERSHPNSIVTLLTKLKAELHMIRNVTVVEYVGAKSPMIVGFLRPVLVLPEDMWNLEADISEKEETAFILKHELIHLKRHDAFVKWMLAITCALHWFNPIIWIMQKNAAIDMELSCDELVVQGKAFSVRKAYTETLLSTLHKNQSPKVLLTTQFYGGKEVMKKRFLNILKGSGRKKGILSQIVIILLTFSMSTLISCTLAAATLPVDYGIDLKADFDGDGKEDRIVVIDSMMGDYFHTQLNTWFSNGTWNQKVYEGAFSSYAVVGDLSGNGQADVLLLRYDTDNPFGAVNISVLRYEEGNLAEYPSQIAESQDISDFAESFLIGATIVEKQNKNYLRLIIPVDIINEETVKCMDLSWQKDGWRVEQSRLITNYYTDGYHHSLLENTYEELRSLNTASAQSGINPL